MRRLLSIFSILLAACSGSGDGAGTVTPPPTPTLAVSLAPAAGSAARGTTTTTTVSVARGGGFAGAVTLAADGVPAGVQVSFSSASLSSGTSSATATIAVGATAAPGNASFTITASGTGVSAASAPFALTVPTPTVGITTSAAATSAVQGASATVGLTLSRTNGFADAITLSASGVPSGVTASFTPATVPAGSTASTLTLTAGATAAPGAYPIVITAAGTGVASVTSTVTLTVTAAATPGITISAVGAQQLSQGTSSATAIPLVLTRTGGLAGDLTLALDGAPAGVTATFAPNPATGSSSQMTLAVSGTATPGNYTVTVRATGAGGATGTTSFPLTITAAATGSVVINVLPSTASVVQGQTGLATVNIARAGGFTGAVTLTSSGAPSGTTVTFTPSVATGAQSQMGIAVGAGTAAGSYTITIRGEGAGVAPVTTSLSLTVTPAGGGTGNVLFRFCDPTEFPLLVAFRNGRTGAWSRANNDGTNRYRFQIDDAGGVAIVKPLAGGTADVTVWYGTAAQLTQVGLEECTSSPATKTLTGSFAGLSPLQVGTVSIGGGFAQSAAGGNGPFTVQNVALGSTDLLAFRSAQGITGAVVSTTPDRGILRRNLDVPANSAIPVLDFNGTEAFTPASAQITVNNAGSGLLQVFAGFQTNAATFGGFTFGALFGGANPYTVYGVPSTLTRAGDFHLVQATTTLLQNNTPVEQRTVTQFNQNLANRTLTLGPSLTTPTYTTLATAPYARIRASAPWQQEYGDQLFANFQQQQAGSSRNWTVFVTRSYSGGAANYEADTPDLSAVSGWNDTWGLRSGVATTVTTFAYSTGTASSILEGLVALTAGRFGTYTP
jgi:hypothetical protein